MEMSNDSAAGIAVHYSESYLALLDESCKTALPFDETDPQQNLLIEEMGRRAKSKKQRAARAAAENQVVGIENSKESQETDCEMPTARSSKIPVLQKGFQVSKGAEKSESSSSMSKIPRPLAQLVYLKERQELPTASSTELPSFTETSGDFTDDDMITGSHKATLPNGLESLPKCDLSSEMESVTNAEKCDPEHLVVVAEANGTELKLDMTAMLSGLDMSLIGLRFL